MIDYKARLDAQVARRTPRNVLGMEAFTVRGTAMDLLTEDASKGITRNNVRYITRAMKEIPDHLTRQILSDGARVGNTVINDSGLNATQRTQGSVPLNIHIEAASDVDMLIVTKDVLLVAQPELPDSRYVDSTISIPEALLDIRANALSVLKKRGLLFENNSKSIKVKADNIACDVDIVPSCWYDTSAYQASKNEVDRGILIMDKDTLAKDENFPFKHMELIESKDKRCQGKSKKVIRLLKTLKYDSQYRQEIKLSSYDIASLVYTMDDRVLNRSRDFELLAESYRYMSFLKDNMHIAKELDTPDETRKIFNTENKLASLTHLINELLSVSEDIVATEGLRSKNIYESLASMSY